MPRRNWNQEVSPLRVEGARAVCSRPLAVGVRTMTLALMVWGIATAWVTLPSAAQSADSPLRFGTWMVQDARAFPGALLSRPSAWIGAGVVGKEFGDANAMRPASIMIFVGSLFQDDRRIQDAAFTGLEALILANLLTNALKAAAGRSRPWQSDDAHEWKPLSGKTSFPSGHATTAFALMTPWVMYIDHPMAWVGMGLAAFSSISRVTLRYHWPSDIVAGALIGSSVAVWLSRRHQRGAAGTGVLSHRPVSPGPRLDPLIGPAHLGLRVTL
ncbi:MAG: phosphatase PAP2 family protein [Bacteroidetes bacterium]|nr:phosphatase PAP2 family protein [Bacteroidota bacterium]